MNTLNTNLLLKFIFSTLFSVRVQRLLKYFDIKFDSFIKREFNKRVQKDFDEFFRKNTDFAIYV